MSNNTTSRNARPVGRPSKLTPETRERLLTAIRGGATIRAAATYAGIGQSTYHQWMAEAREESPRAEFLEFAEAIDRARAELQVDVLDSVREAIRGGFVVKRARRFRGDQEEVEEQVAPPDGRLGLDLLSRIWPADFARRSGVEVSGPGGGPVEVATRERISVLAGRVTAALSAALAEEDGAAPGSDG